MEKDIIAWLDHQAPTRAWRIASELAAPRSEVEAALKALLRQGKVQRQAATAFEGGGAYWSVVE